MGQNNSKTTIHMVASLDGFIAKPDKSIDWMHSQDMYEHGIELSQKEINDFLAGIDCYVMGSKTYERALELGWPYGDTPVVVLTSRKLEAIKDTVSFYSGDLTECIQNHLKPKYRNIWIVGGAALTREILRMQLWNSLSMRNTNHLEQQSQHLVTEAIAGDRSALEQLIRLHEPFIYNVAWKYTNDPIEAKDLSQEAFIKIITKLSTFEGRSSFQSWAYRIVVNQFLQTKRRPAEDRWKRFDDFAHELNQIPNPDLSPEEEEEQILRTKTARTRCMSGMLMCLTREQRLLYLIGDVFNIDHNIGSEIFGLSKDNYRKKLSRTRKEFHAFMNKQCGLVKLDNPCRCSKKAKAMEAAGKMQTNTKLFDPKFSATIAKYAESVADEVADIVDKKYIAFFQKHPTKDDFDTNTIIEELINDPDLHRHIDNFLDTWLPNTYL